MGDPRGYSRLTIKRLYGLSGNQCAFPDCQSILVDEETATHSNICHIEAAEKGGERYREDMNDKERADYDNLILLCPPHHKTTDDTVRYTVDVLKDMKKVHEAKVAINSNLLQRPTLLADTINQICDINIDDGTLTPVENAFSIDDKISYNCLVRNKPIIEELSIYQGRLNTLYIELERAGTGKKDTLLRNIKSLYLKTKGEILGTAQYLSNIQKKSDVLLENVQRKLHDLIECSPNNNQDLPYEDVEFAVQIIVVDAFMRCKILEEPQNNGI